jgi:hypothetical protein
MQRAIVALSALLALGACAGSRTCAPPCGSPCGDSHGVFARLATNDWLVSQRADLWKIVEEAPPAAPRHVGFVVAREYRQEAGATTYRIYTVTGRDRRNELGHVDQMGRAVRYVPVRGGGIDRVDVGQGTLQDSVAAILDTTNRIVLEQTSERRLAFEALDRNGSGVLEQPEMAAAGARVASADRNRDGVVDFGEFDALDVL